MPSEKLALHGHWGSNISQPLATSDRATPALSTLVLKGGRMKAASSVEKLAKEGKVWGVLGSVAPD